MAAHANLSQHPAVHSGSSATIPRIRPSRVEADHDQEPAAFDGPSASGFLLGQEAWGVTERSLNLSKRECQIVRLVFEDQKESAIGIALGISRHTVNTYLKRMYQKLGVASRAQLIVHVMAQYVSLSGQPDQSQARPGQSDRL